MGIEQLVPILRGRHVSLEPLHPSHADGLRAAATDGALWEIVYANVPKPNAVDAYIAAALRMQQDGVSMPFAVRDSAGALVGTTRFYDIAAEVPRLSIGYTWYAQRVQRTALNTEAKLLLLGHAFEAMRCACVALETSALNQRSRAAIARLGARQDGILRSHRRHGDGSLRDTVVFSIIADEWPAVKAHLQSRLAAHGRSGGTLPLPVDSA